MANVQLDEKNKKILEQLLKNCRLSCRELAKILGMSPTSVLLRIKDMERKGIIKNYNAVLDHEVLGYDLAVITEITVSKGKLLQVEKEIAQIPNVLAIYDVTGLTDAIIIAKFKNRKELSQFTKKLLSMPFIERSNTHVVLNTIKEDFRLL